MRILGPNDTGKGILVEWDAGIINPNEVRNSDVIKESYGQLEHSKPFVFYATLQKYGVPNRNGRVYPEKILKREAENYKKAIAKGLSTSELNHPESSLIDLDRVSHIINEIWWEGNVLMGKLKLLTSPGFHERGVCSTKGDLAANYLRQGVTLGISSRGVGSLKKVGEQSKNLKIDKKDIKINKPRCIIIRPYKKKSLETQKHDFIKLGFKHIIINMQACSEQVTYNLPNFEKYLRFFKRGLV